MPRQNSKTKIATSNKISAPKTEQRKDSKLNAGLNSSTNMLFTLPEKIISYRPSTRVMIILVILAALLFVAYKKEWFVAATVNGQPITTLDLLSRLNQQYREPVLNQLINEKLVFDEARKNNIVIADEEINQKVTELEANVGGAETLDSLLAQQGATRDSFKQQVRLQLIVEKLYQSEATISAKELDEFIKNSGDLLQATEAATQRKEAEEALRQQKISQIFNQKFQELKQAADIKTF